MPAGALLFDATNTPATVDLTISDGGAAGDGWSEVVDVDGSGFAHHRRFSGFTTLTVRGGPGSELIDLVGLDTLNPPATVTLDGDNTTDDDNSADTLQVRSTPANVDVTLLGGLGSDNFWLFNQDTAGDAANTVDGIQGTVTVSPTGSDNTPAAGDDDTLTIVDRADTSGDAAIAVTDTTIDGIFDSGSGTTDVTYNPNQLDSVTLITSGGNDTVDVDFGDTGGSDLDDVTINTAGGMDRIRVLSDTAPGVTTRLDGDEDVTGAPNTGANNDILDFSQFTTPRHVLLTGYGAIDGFTGTEASIQGPGSQFTNIDALIGTGDDTLETSIDDPAHWDLGGDVVSGGYGLTTGDLPTDPLQNTGVLVLNVANMNVTDNAAVIGRDTGANPITANETLDEQDLGFTGFDTLVGAATASDWFDLRAGASLTGSDRRPRRQR